MARAVVLATGLDWRRLQAKGEDRLLGPGIFYRAARQQAINVVGKRVVIVRGGNSACQAAMFLSSYAAEVKILVRGEGLKLSMSKYLIDQIASKANIKVVPYTQVISAVGEDRLERIEAAVQSPTEIEDILTYEADALFVMIGADAKCRGSRANWVSSGVGEAAWPLLLSINTSPYSMGRRCRRPLPAKTFEPSGGGNKELGKDERPGPAQRRLQQGRSFP